MAKLEFGMGRKWNGIFRKWAEFLRDRLQPDPNGMSLEEKDDEMYRQMSEFCRGEDYSKNTLNTMLNRIPFRDIFFSNLHGEKYPELNYCAENLVGFEKHSIGGKK